MRNSKTHDIRVGDKARQKLAMPKDRIVRREAVLALARAVDILATVRAQALIDGGPGWSSVVGACDVAETEIRFAVSKLSIR